MEKRVLSPKKQDQKVIFSSKVNKIDHSPLHFKQSYVESLSTQNHAGRTLDNKKAFNFQLKNKSKDMHNKYGFLRKLY